MRVSGAQICGCSGGGPRNSLIQEEEGGEGHGPLEAKQQTHAACSANKRTTLAGCRRCCCCCYCLPAHLLQPLQRRAPLRERWCHRRKVGPVQPHHPLQLLPPQPQLPHHLLPAGQLLQCAQQRHTHGPGQRMCTGLACANDKRLRCCCWGQNTKQPLCDSALHAAQPVPGHCRPCEAAWSLFPLADQQQQWGPH